MPRDHFVPRFYLSNFAREVEGRRRPAVWVYDKDGREPTAQTPEDTAVQRDFYSFTDADGNKRRDIDAMLTELEGEAFPIVDRWIQPRARLTQAEKEAFAPFLAFGYTRTPRQVEIAKEQANAMSKEFVRYLAAHPETLKATVEAYQRDTGENLRIGFEELQAAFQSFEDRFRITANEKEAQKLSLKVTLAFVPILLEMNWSLCRAARGSYFITSDAPVCPFVLEPDGTAIVGAGFGRRDAEVTLPLSPDVCLLLDWRRKVSRMAIGSKMVWEFNKRTAANAERFVVSPYRTAAVSALVDTWRATRRRPKLDPRQLTEQMRAVVEQGFLETKASEGP